jgi:twitching motility protein PilT
MLVDIQKAGCVGLSLLCGWSMDKTIINKLLKFGVERGASDILFEVGSPPCYRIKGELLKTRADPLNPETTTAIAQILLQDRPLDLTNLFPEQDTSYSLPGVSRFRASIFRQRGTIACVLRVIPFEVRVIEELNLPPVIADIANLRRGLVLVTGATGQGKSTTIAGMLEHINASHQSHIVTIEDPIEFLFESKLSVVTQREVGTDTYSYKDAMIAALRQDPDVIMLGEVRDEVTANVCLRAAETGHLVITTLHTPDASSTIKRFTGFFEQGQMNAQLSRFADCLQAVICLRLLPRADDSGLIPAVEILRVTHAIQECIRQQERHNEIQEHIARGRDPYRMQTFDQHLMDLVRNNMVKLDVAKTAASVPAELDRAMLVE